jgi:hypothetical protein
MAGSLVSAWAKWGRANVHYEALERETTSGRHPVAGFTEYRASVESEADGLEYRFYFDLPPPDPTIALIAGDCWYDLRAALDHMVYALHERHYRGRIPSAAEDRPQFPIYTDVPRFKDGRKKGQPIETNKWNSIRDLAERQRRAIAFLQPYNTRDDALKYVRRNLGTLVRFNNIDKHRHMHVVRNQHFMVGVPTGWDEYGFWNRPFFGPIEGKTEILRWRFASGPPPDIAHQIELNRYISTSIGIDEGSGDILLTPHTKVLIDVVERVLNRFAPLFR